jgi:cysteine-S-conjugate beta-lyase
MSRKPRRPETRIAHSGSHPEKFRGAMNPPVYRASTVVFPTGAAMREASRNRFDTVYYGRHGTPTSFALEEAMADLEGGHRSVAVCSGLAAITVAILAFVKSGDHVLLADTVYDPTRRLAQFLGDMGIETSFYDPLAGAAVAGLIRTNTKIVFCESPGSLTFEVQDVPAIAAAAHAKGVKVLLDNTWAAGHFFKPFEHGVDVSIQAATKYIAGHADVMIGLVTAKTEEDWRAVKTMSAVLGYLAGPDECYLALRGLKTLDVRLERHQETGLALARWCAARPEVHTVLHPALPSCPGHDVWKRDFTGASGLFSVVLNEVPMTRVEAMLDGMEIFAMGFSWGGFESLIIPADPATIRTATKWRATGPLIRLHAGQEDVADLIADLEDGFARLTAGR